MTEILIRRATKPDHIATRQIVDDAFRPEDVVTFLDALRGDGCLLGEWMASDPSGAVGYIAFSRVWVEGVDGHRTRGALLTPLAVRPDRQRRGVGSRLMAAAHATLDSEGEALFLVLGHPEYYPRAGYSSAAARVIASPWSSEPAFMARGALIPPGKLILPAVIAEAH